MKGEFTVKFADKSSMTIPKERGDYALLGMNGGVLWVKDEHSVVHLFSPRHWVEVIDDGQ